jgi:hypothetical protein
MYKRRLKMSSAAVTNPERLLSARLRYIGYGRHILLKKSDINK